MKKLLKIGCPLLLFCLLLMGVLSAEAALYTRGDQKVTFFNGSSWWTENTDWYQTTDEAEMDEYGRLFVPLSALHDAFGFDARETSGNTVTVKSRDHVIYQGIDNICVYINNVAYNDTAPYRKENGTVMVPAERYLSALGYKTEYKTDAVYPGGFLEITRQNQTVTISKIEVNKYMQMVMVYGKDYGGKEALYQYMVCSTGTAGRNETPAGTFRANPLRYYKNSADPWYYFKTSVCWVQYCTQVNGNICFHSIPYNNLSYQSLSRSGYNALGRKASHGCIRLMAEDARVIWENAKGATVIIYDGGYSAELAQKKEEILAARSSYTDYRNHLVNNGVS